MDEMGESSSSNPVDDIQIEESDRRLFSNMDIDISTFQNIYGNVQSNSDDEEQEVSGIFLVIMIIKLWESIVVE